MEGLTYTKVGDYLIPDLMMDGEDEAGETPLGKYGTLRETFLKEHRHGTYTSMMLTGRLMPHLRETDSRAQEMADRTLAELMEAGGVDEDLKARDQMAWVQAVNRLTAQAEEQALREIVYR